MNFFGIGIQELLVIFLICLLLFGAKRLPEIGKALGNTIKEFKKSMKEDSSDVTTKRKRKKGRKSSGSSVKPDRTS